ncbi:MAG TPA: polysaccharide deacetylase family protein [Sphingomicrobium sp.]|nr:polysaccharide deacetylase family protein [Sphingomicrobium sp.]
MSVGTIKSALRGTAKAAVFSALGNGPMLRRRLDRVREAGVTTILNLHRVGPDDRSSYRPLPAPLFDELLRFVTREFAVVTFAELGEPARKPKLIVSFDDGYQDFVTHAAPILKKHGVRANQNLIPKCVETGLPPLNVLAQDFIGKAPAELRGHLTIDGYTGPRDGMFGQRLSHFIKMRSQAEQVRLAAELLPQFYAWHDFRPTRMMNAEEARSIAEHELGAHSWAHASMEFESDDYLDADVRRCADWFKATLGKPMTIYAFPNGSCRAGQVEKVLSHGVEHVLLVGDGFDRGGPVHQRFTFDARSPSEARFKALGGLAPL